MLKAFVQLLTYIAFASMHSLVSCNLLCNVIDTTIECKNTFNFEDKTHHTFKLSNLGKLKLLSLNEQLYGNALTEGTTYLTLTISHSGSLPTNSLDTFNPSRTKEMVVSKGRAVGTHSRFMCNQYFQ